MRPEGEDSPGVDAEGPLTCGVSRCSGLSKYSSTRTISSPSTHAARRLSSVPATPSEASERNQPDEHNDHAQPHTHEDRENDSNDHEDATKG